MVGQVNNFAVYDFSTFVRMMSVVERRDFRWRYAWRKQ